MDTIKYLSQVINLERELERKQEQLIRLEQRMIYVSPSFDTEASGGGSRSNEKLAKQVAEKELLENNIKNLERKIKETRARLIRIIDSIEDHDACDVIYMRYIRNFSFKKISEIMERSISWVYYKHGVAVDITTTKLEKYKPHFTKKLYLINLFNMEVVKHDSLPNLAEYLNIPLGTANAMVAQGSRRRNHIIVDDPNDTEKLSKILEKYM